MNASYSRRTHTQVFQEIAVEWPVSLVDFEKVAALARNNLVPGAERDNTFTIMSTDEELIIQWISDDRRVEKPYCGLGPCCLEAGHAGGCKQ